MLKRVILLVLVLNVYVAVNTDTQSNLRSESNLRSGNETEGGSCFKVDQVMDDVEPVVIEDKCEPKILYSDVIYNGICTSDTPCGRCIGECDGDSDCAGDLTCIQREGYEVVPGCISYGPGDFATYDYCHDASCPTDYAQTCGPLPLQSAAQADGICTDSTPCGQCQGECDFDSHCANEMICFQRSGHPKVPGCISGGSGDIQDYDYCVHPQCEFADQSALFYCKTGKVAPTITYKSVPGTQVAGGSIEQWEARMTVSSDPPETCETSLTDLAGLNNRANCPGGSNGNFYFKYTVTFDLCQDMLMFWHVPLDAGYGGVSVMNGVEMARYDGDMWNTDKIDFSVTLLAGQHTFELYGGEGCCDGQTSWQVNGQDLDLTEMMSW